MAEKTVRHGDKLGTREQKAEVAGSLRLEIQVPGKMEICHWENQQAYRKK